MAKKILVTGGAGYVGNAVVRELLKNGYGVRVLDKMVFTDTFLREVRDRIEIVCGDINKIGPEIMDGISGVIHLAGISTEPTAQFSPRLTDIFNHIGTENIALLAKNSGVKRFVFASSCSVYFTYDTSLEPNLYTENDNVNPISPYALSKRAAEQALVEIEDNGFEPVIFRKGTIYGWSPRMRYDLVVNSFTKDAFLKREMTVNCGGRLWRPLADIQDVACAYVKALELPAEKVSGKIFNLCSENWNIGDLAKRVQKLLRDKKDVDVAINTQEVGLTRNYKADSSLFASVFGLKPSRTFEDAVLEIWNQLEKNPGDAKNPLFYNDKWQIEMIKSGKMQNGQNVSKKILIIGADGQLGTDLVKSMKSEELLTPSIGELDVADFNKTREYIRTNNPEIIINTAAFHQVDDCDKNSAKSFLLNTDAVKNLVDICKELDITLVHISTDYVFGLDLERNVPYSEDDVPGPINVYGVSKLAGESFIRYGLEKYFIIRPAGLFGVAGAKGKGGNFIETMLKLARQNGTVKVKDDEFTTPTSTKELADNIAALITTGKYGLYHMTSQGQCSWYEFAKKIFELTKTPVECLPIKSAELPTIARRPAYSVLENRRLKEIGLDMMSSWEIALKDYLQAKGYLNQIDNKTNQNMAENKKTKIDGLEIASLRVNFDDRGYLFEIVHNYDIPKFGQVYIVGDPVRGLVRAFHKHDILWDYFCIVKGSAKFVFSDDRKESKTYKQLETVVISEKSPKMIIVPPGVYHGWMSLEDNTIMVSTGSEVYNKEKPDEYRISPDTFGDVWTIKGK